VEGQHGNGREVKAFDGFTGKFLWSLRSSKTNGSGVVTDATGKFVTFQTADWTGDFAHTALVEASSGRVIKTLAWQPAAVGPRGLYAVCASPSIHDRGYSLITETKGTPLVTLGIDGDQVVGAAFDPAGNQLAWGNSDGSVTVCDLKEIHERLGQVGLAWPNR
jgi:hypothetical protein